MKKNTVSLFDSEMPQVAMQEYLDFLALRGCSDFIYVPGTNDCHVFVTRTEETLEGYPNNFGKRSELGPALAATCSFFGAPP